MGDKSQDLFYLMELADTLDKATRLGGEKDDPEGLRYILISDTLAQQISERLREIVNGMKRVIND